MSPTVLEQSEALHRRVRDFIVASTRGDGCESFDAVALDIARFQARHVAPVSRLVRARAVDLDRATSAEAIPAVPCDAFRFARVAAHPPEQDAVVFCTSGTTAVTRGEHPLRTTATYELGAVEWARAMLFPDAPSPHDDTAFAALSLIPPPSDAPDSSLSFMVDHFASVLGGPSSWHMRATGDEGRPMDLDVEGLNAACATLRDEGRAAIVFGTSFAFVHLAARLHPRHRLHLPVGSRAMQTGGFKGRTREVPPEAMRRLIATTFGIDDSRVVGEYGMTELSSQLYDSTLSGASAEAYVAPPWLRATAVHPATLEPLPEGEVGLVRLVDLANVDSAVAVQTSDVGRVARGKLELRGRQPGAVPRGCSLAIDQALGR